MFRTRRRLQILKVIQKRVKKKLTNLTCPITKCRTSAENRFTFVPKNGARKYFYDAKALANYMNHSNKLCCPITREFFNSVELRRLQRNSNVKINSLHATQKLWGAILNNVLIDYSNKVLSHDNIFDPQVLSHFVLLYFSNKAKYRNLMNRFERRCTTEVDEFTFDFFKSFIEKSCSDFDPVEVHYSFDHCVMIPYLAFIKNSAKMYAKESKNLHFLTCTLAVNSSVNVYEAVRRGTLGSLP